MSKKLYVSSTGVSHKTAKLRVGINNVSRNVVKGYIGVNNVAKQFWPDEPIYVWNRYNIVPEYKYSVTYMHNTGYPYEYICSWGKKTSGSFAKFASFDPNTAKITLSNIQTYDYDWLCDNTSMTVMFAYITTYNTEKPLNVSPNEVYSTGASEGTFSQWYQIGISSGRHMTFHVPVIKSYINDYIQGSYIDQVMSKTRSAYPDNGMSGSYWYVYAGTV